MRERHLREVSTATAEHERADRIAAEILAEHGTPVSYERIHTLIALGYLKGNMDGIRWASEKLGGAA